MTAKSIVLATLLTVFAYTASNAQNNGSATDRGASIVSGSISFSSSGGDLYVGSGDRLNLFELMPSVVFFASRGIGIGAEGSLSFVSQGDNSATGLSIGPSVGYYHEGNGSSIPFIAIGASIMRLGDGDNSETGYRFKAGPGFIAKKGHLGVTAQVAYVVDRFKFDGENSATTGNMITLSVGFVGLLY